MGLQGLFEWRDAVARAEDESTGYVLPNKTLLEIGRTLLHFLTASTLYSLANTLWLTFLLCLEIVKAKEMPVTTSKLRRLLKSKHPYIERNLGPIVSIIRHSMQNAAAFEATAQQLKEVHTEIVRLVCTNLMIMNFT